MEILEKNKKYYFDYKLKQFKRHESYLDNENKKISDKSKELLEVYDDIKSNMEK